VPLPHVEEDLLEVDHLDDPDPLRHYRYSDKIVRQLSITDRRLSNGRISRINAQRATLNRVSIQSAYIESCVFTSAEWVECILNRVIFRDCKILGATFSGGKWANVVFDECKIEYAEFDSIRATAPVAFLNTVFSEVTFEGCDLPGGHMSGCQLRKVEFVGGGFHEFDLRHTDLSTIRGAANLAGAVVSPGQRQELAEALVSELDFHYLDEGDQ
jgi:uncharacterized protein YjbI with pentapeptide repeats